MAHNMPNERLKWLMLFAAVAVFATAISTTNAANPPDADQKGPVFLKEPTNRIDFSNSTGAEIECKSSGNPMPEIIWIRSDGTAVGDVPGLRQISSDGKLVFPPFRAEDYRQEVHAQVYACLARNQFGSIISRDVHVRAVVPQSYSVNVMDESILRGNSAILKCHIPSFVADFIVVDSWLEDEEREIYPQEDVTVSDGKYLVLPSGELHIREVGPEDGYKSYQCRTKHRLTGETRLSATKGRLVITEPISAKAPTLSTDTKWSGIERHLGMDIVLLCPAQAYPVPISRWYKFIEGTTRKQAVVLNDRVKQVSGTLIIKDAVVEDSGKYLCVVNNSVGGESVETVLTVTAPLSAKIDPPTQTVDFGRPAVFTCQYTGNPIKTVSWMKDGKAIGHSEPVLRIESVKKEDKGMYQCFVRNDQESAEASAELKLGGRFDPPVIRQAFQEETMEPGPSVFLKCVAGGNPTPEISWELDGKKIANNDRYQVGQYVTVNGDVVSYLNITSVHANDGGLYKCIAKSKVGVAEHSAKLNVYGLPYIRQMEKKAIVAGETLMVTCPVAGYPIDSIVWERDNRALPINRKQKVFPNGTLIIENVERNSDQATYTCVAKNQEGYSARGSLEVQVMVPPQVSPFNFGSEVLNMGDVLSVTCLTLKGDLPLKIQWTLNGAPIATGVDGFMIIQLNSRTSYLSVDALEAKHRGVYSCIAQNPAGRAVYQAELQVNGGLIIRFPVYYIFKRCSFLYCCFYILTKLCFFWSFDEYELNCNKLEFILNTVAPQISPFLFGDEPLNRGEVASVNCVVPKGDLPLDIYWTINSALIVNGELGFTIVRLNKRTSSLNVDSLEAAHRGTYKCIANNSAGYAEYIANLEVNVPPRWILEPTDKAFAQGSDAKVECKADGFPKPQVTWKKAVGDTPGEYKDLKKSDNIRVEEGTLHIDNIQKTNEGYYLCEAINGIGSGLSAVIMVSVQAPPEFTEKLRNQTARRGEPAVLQCEAKGEKPIGILWNMNNMRLDPKNDNRYTIREEILSAGVMSSLSIKRTERSDSALFTCVATNAFGSDDASINMIVQEVPEMPYALKVLDKSGRSVQLSWAQPYDGNSPLNRYIIEFKRSRASWSEIDRVMVPGHTTEAQVQKLSPATTYNIRIVAENAIGTSQSSEAVTIITAEEAPSGKPQNIKVEPVNQTTMRVTWKPPPRSEWNGEILGYYVGYKLSNTNSSYVFETINFITEEGKEHNLELQNLRVYTQYSVVIQAFNKIGAGPLCDEEKQFTAEGTPSQPPSDTACTTLTSQTIRVSWVSPPLESANGVIKTYKVVYASSDEWYDETKRHYKKTASSDTVLHGLKKYTNYTMQVLATTAGGDGVRSVPIHCQTEPDVPEAPTDVKALVMGNAAILVSWRAPAQPNGIITQYTVYSKAEGAETETKTQKVPHYQMSFEATELEKNKPYEFWVTASTTIGEGQQSKSIVAMPSDQVPAKIASFDDTFTATFKEDAKMPCLAVGAPQPEITWKIKGVEFTANDRMRLLPDGSLLIKSVNRQDAGDYSCHAENSIAKDSITHKLIVLAPPQSPHVTLSATTTDTLTVKLKPHEGDTAPLHGYTLHYKPEFGEWETAEVSVESQKQNIEGLLCGSRYQVYATGFNNIGAGEASDILNTRTKGQKPKLPEKPRFIEVSSNSVSLHFKAWKDGGCPMSHFVVESKKRDQIEWNQISNNVKPDNNYVVLDLEPATWYNLRITAHNSAGFTVAEYDFATLTVTGGTLAPLDGGSGHGNVHARIPLPAWMPEWLDLNFMVPLIATVVVVAVGICVVCVALSRRRADDMRGGQKDVYYDVVYNQTMGPGATLDKRRPDLRDELGYIAPPNRKLPPVPGSNYNTCDRIKRGTVISRGGGLRSNHSTWDPRRPNLYEELKAPPVPMHGNHYGHAHAHAGNVECHYRHPGMEDEICPYATFHLLGFREEMDPTKAMNFQTFPHQNGHAGPVGPGHAGTMLPPGHPGHVHSRSGSQSMPRANRYQRKNSQGGQSSIYTPAPEYDDPANCAEEDQYRRYTRVNSQGGSLYSGPGPEYDDPANCAPEEDQYGSQYGGPYGQPYDHYGSRGSMGRRSIGSARNPGTGSPEPPPPPPRNHDMSNSSFNDSKESNEISEAECDRDHGPRGNYGAVKRSPQPKDQRTTEEMRKLIERNEAGTKQLQLQQTNGAGFTAYDTMAV
ncbi:Down syndrome cell adhesion molecule-like protein Dscam2 isoform X6 [Drosophila willistoni]|uniref:Down syndrome cell adhesion molecule-like protein Dscam2 isoform X6 n=1 Tax=Drosophila willistoni TaxID=7260 RepID=UPI001F087AE3|nr:Down syndrome cell adhesion molecule-like protein Dscam2 isoform X6 [Drosophila willistoni]